MSIVAENLDFFLSGGATNTDPNASLGGIISSTEVVDNSLSNLFDEVTGDEHTAGDISYRCIYFKNSSAETAYNVKLWIESNTTGADSAITIGLDLAGVNGTADTIPDEKTAPDPAVTFVTADGQANALSLGNMTAGQVYAFWIKRVITAGSTPQANDTAQLKIYVDTL
jgi:hypothetical protein